MKGTHVIILIFVSLVISILLHYDKVSYKKDNIDILETALTGLINITPPGTSINFRTEPGNFDIMSQARFVLAPRFLALDSKYDTTLTIQYLQNGDSTLDNFVKNRKLIWSRADDQYYYALTRNR